MYYPLKMGYPNFRCKLSFVSFFSTTGLLFSVFLFLEIVGAAVNSCETVVSHELRDEIRGYQKVATEIVDTIVSGKFKGRAYANLVEFVDKFGPRAAGTDGLERSIDFMMGKMRHDGLENVREEAVTVPYWIRGEEKATLVTPIEKTIKILGLGHSVATPPGGITARAIVVRTFEELTARAHEAKGRIVVFNQEYGPDYFSSAQYRMNGAVEAAKVGAVASLVRSVTPFSIYSPHTGIIKYEPGIAHIPAAAMAVEDAQFLYRMESRGENLTISLILNDKTEQPKVSRNTMSDLKGQAKQDKVVIISCHIDSWDVAVGAMDDAGGCFISLEALNILNHLKLRPKRTIRTILFTGEEMALYGADQYVEKHQAEMDTVNVIMESDFGTFTPHGLDVTGTETAACIVKEILSLLKSINVTLTMRRQPMVGADTIPFSKKGVPAVSLITQEEKYMSFHHTEADTVTVENPDEVDLCLALWTVSAYVLADLSADLPRK